jgi:Tfp pilus assembly protein PilO
MIYKKHPIILINSFILLLMYFLLVIPQHKQLGHNEVKFMRLSQEIKQQSAQIERSSQDKQKLDELNLKWQSLQINGLNPSEINNVFTELEALAKQSNIDLYYEAVNQTINITLQSDYISLLNFIDTLIQHPYFLLNDLQLKRNSGVIFTTLSLQILLADEHV